ncbi:MAG: hypothetical protein EA001_16175 [Oscillatoriales cyanobacterium]|nr:MAG: hypothetical protein EA001_16175 [Oscillatoriales cyanobacterium]
MAIRHFSARLSAISMFIDRAFTVDDANLSTVNRTYTPEEWNCFGAAEHDRAAGVLIDYEGIVIRAALSELNALVEYELKWVAKSIYQQRYGSHRTSKSKLSRKKINEIHQIIEQEFQIQLKDLPGFAEITNMRRVINAYKHDDGYSGQYEPFLTVAIEKKYELDLQMVKQYIEAVRSFLTALPGERLNLGQDVRIKQIRS